MVRKAKETEYNGYKFRSRLEARWAYFFDLMGIEYEYEPEGIILSNGKPYLPDFYLPHFKCYFEVKRKGLIGKDKDEAIRKIKDGAYTDSWAGIICFGDPMDDYIHIYCQEIDDGGGGSYNNRITFGIHPHTKEPYLFSYTDRRARDFFTHFGSDMGSWRIPMETTLYNYFEYGQFVNNKVVESRKLARQARFEFGETPVINKKYACV